MKKLNEWDYYKYNYLSNSENKQPTGNEIYTIDGKKYKWGERCYFGHVIGEWFWIVCIVAIVILLTSGMWGELFW